MVPDGHKRHCRGCRDLVRSIPHLPTSVAAALYRSGVINGSETSADRARAMMQCIG